ncbi:hypothetical protein Hanom_Chr11g00982491 [Helianthus anomalus]
MCMYGIGLQRGWMMVMKLLSMVLKLDYPHQTTSCGGSCKCKHSHWILHLLLHTLNYVEAIASQDSEKESVSPATGMSNHNQGYRELANWYVSFFSPFTFFHFHINLEPVNGCSSLF